MPDDQQTILQRINQMTRIDEGPVKPVNWWIRI